MTDKNIKFVFFGTSDFSLKILDILRKNNFIPDLIVTVPDKPKGRKKELSPPPIKTWARKYNINFIQPVSLKKLDDDSPVKSMDYDLFIVAAYGKIIPRDIINAPKYGTINVHPSILPKYRGPSPIQYFILSGEEETGVTIMLIDEEVDHGPIIRSEKLKMQSEKLNFKRLEDKLAELGGEILVEVMPEWINGEIKPLEQDHSKVTFTKKITKEEGYVDLEKDNPEIIYRKFRAFYPWPGIYFFTEKAGKKIRVIITEAEVKDNALAIKRVKPEGKNEMSYEDFLRGYKKRPF